MKTFSDTSDHRYPKIGAVRRVLIGYLCLVTAPILLAGCAHNTTVSSVQAVNFYSENENKIQEEAKYSVDQTSLEKLSKKDTVQGFICSAHKFPIDGSEALIASLPSMMEQVFESAQKSDANRTNSGLMFLFRVERFDPRLKFNDKFFSVDAEATVEIGLSVVGYRDGVRVFGTTVDTQRTRSGSGGAVCDGGGAVLADATRDAIKDVLEKIGERMANSQKLSDRSSNTVKTSATKVTAKEEMQSTPISSISKLYPPLNPNSFKQVPTKDATAIIIGISKYKKIPVADFAAEDAKSFQLYANKSIGIKPENTRILVDSEADYAEIIKAFKNWLPLHVTPNKTELFVFFSGHGLPSEDGKTLYLLPFSADRDLLDRTAINQSELIRLITDANPKSVTMIMDSCYSGMTKTGDALIADARPVVLRTDAMTLPRNFTLLSASAPEQISSSSKDLGHGIFSYFLMKGLEGAADLNEDKQITLAEIHAYASQNVKKMASTLNRSQDPQLIGDGSRVISKAIKR
jgi:hypothetical protein